MHLRGIINLICNETQADFTHLPDQFHWSIDILQIAPADNVNLLGIHDMNTTKQSSTTICV